MSSFDIKNNQDLDYQETASQFYEALTEYLILKDRYEEPIEAVNLRKQAEETLRLDHNDYITAFNFLSTALKLFKAYNDLS
ncbi:MAG: hypothetical protein GNW80_14160 [Asgard group archaeon]|nr:hypothetical protein [Asgard group archaeon]